MVGNVDFVYFDENPMAARARLAGFGEGGKAGQSFTCQFRGRYMHDCTREVWSERDATPALDSLLSHFQISCMYP